MREIKFRCWHTHEGWKKDGKPIDAGWETGYVIYPNGAITFPEGGWDINGGDEKPEHFVLEQFTGLLDKHGKEIYKGDILRCQVFMGDDKEYWSDGYYKVNMTIYRGLELSFLKPTSDEKENQYPVIQHPSFEYRTLCVDYVNQKYDHLAFADCFGSNAMSGKRWKENWYTNDIEIIGNIHETPELL